MNDTDPLAFLLAQAREARDAQSQALRAAAQGWQQAQATLSQLQAFREQFLTRSPNLRTRCDGAGVMRDWQGFAQGLANAMTQQAAQAEGHRQRHAQQQQRLAEAQARVLALEALEARRAAAQARVQERRLQRECDEFAARAARIAQEARG